MNFDVNALRDSDMMHGGEGVKICQEIVTDIIESVASLYTGDKHIFQLNIFHGKKMGK